MLRSLLRRTPAPAPDPLAVAEVAEAAALAAQADAERRAALAKAAVADAETAAKLDAIRHRAALERRRRERRASAEEARDAEAARLAHVAAGRRKRSTTAAHVRTVLSDNASRLRRLTVNVIVNGGAGYGQFRFFHLNLHLPAGAAVMLAAGLELVAVTVLDYGIVARREGRRYHAKFAAAGLLAALVAAINYTHWSGAPGLHGLAIPSALLSLLGPPMWMWYADATRPDGGPVRAVAGGAATARTVAEGGDTVAHGPAWRVAEFDWAQWLLWSRLVFAAKRQAVIHRITDPEQALRAARAHLDDKRAARDDKRAERAAKIAQRRAERTARIEARRLARLEAKQRKELDSGRDPYLPTPQEVAGMSDEEKRETARDAIRAAKLDGVALKADKIANALGMSESWARMRIKEVREVLQGEIDDTPDEQEQAK
ncbi:hypothetical protein F5972_08700 [Microbispora cellulosiformans]|uniref:DUF2637 domain-containing protein n=1 Tax=Microbispora cellulosiformans TaxID=2614688 RepID=A0A5J5K6F3_9ACTN|nr:hypothetical protein [Microbispora cellulosiformans]KAA9379720.1 hypothetical protein F5972_08700 [Microbispora cellulosiformans]